MSSNELNWVTTNVTTLSTSQLSAIVVMILERMNLRVQHRLKPELAFRLVDRQVLDINLPPPPPTHKGEQQ